MTTEDNGPRAMIAYVARNMTCNTCGEAYGHETVQVVLHEDTRWVLMATCPACADVRTITAYDQPPYVQLQRTGPITVGPISQATVDRWSAYLAEFEGDMFDLLGE